MEPGKGVRKECEEHAETMDRLREVYDVCVRREI